MLDTLHAGAASCALTLLQRIRAAAKQYIDLPDGRYTKVRDYDLASRSVQAPRDRGSR